MSRAIIPSLLLAGLVLGGCAQMELTRSGALSSYDGMTSSDGILTKTRLRIDRDRLLKSKSAYLARTRIALSNRDPNLSDEHLSVVTNVVDRTMCARLAEKYVIVANQKDADFSILVTITAIEPTNVVAAGFSSVVGIGGTIVNATTGVPVRVPRLPIGLGGLSVEAEALDRNRRALASFEWARGADSLTSRPRASSEADAYALASEFGTDFANLLITGEDPMKITSTQLPSSKSIGEFLGVASEENACAEYGRNPGLAGFAGSVFGVPPSWTDSGKSGHSRPPIADRAAADP